jgi:hypothetical protein
VLWATPLLIALGLTLWLSGAAHAAAPATPFEQTTPVTATEPGTAAAVPAGNPLGPAALAPITPLTVTIAGAEDSAALNAFLRFLIAAYSYYGPYAGPVTATVGALPAQLPVDLPLPADVKVLGSLARSGLYGETQLFLASEGPVAEFVASLRGELVEQGFVQPPAGEPSGPFYQVFVSLPSPDPGPLCSPDKNFTVSFLPQAVVGAGEAVVININPVQSMGNFCTGPAYAPVEAPSIKKAARVRPHSWGWGIAA